MANRLAGDIISHSAKRARRVVGLREELEESEPAGGTLGQLVEAVYLSFQGLGIWIMSHMALEFLDEADAMSRSLLNSGGWRSPDVGFYATIESSWERSDAR